LAPGEGRAPIVQVPSFAEIGLDNIFLSACVRRTPGRYREEPKVQVGPRNKEAESPTKSERIRKSQASELLRQMRRLRVSKVSKAAEE
jgi:hypothetical protein